MSRSHLHPKYRFDLTGPRLNESPEQATKRRLEMLSTSDCRDNKAFLAALRRQVRREQEHEEK